MYFVVARVYVVELVHPVASGYGLFATRNEGDFCVGNGVALFVSNHPSQGDVYVVFDVNLFVDGF